MLEFINAIGIESLVTVLVLLVMTVYFVITKQYSKLQSIAYALMLQAERIMSTNTGAEKMEAVFSKFYNLIPKWLKTFVKEQTLRKQLQDWYNLAKDYLDDQL